MADSSRKKICRTIKDFEREKRKKKRIEIERMRILEIWKVITKFWATDTWDQLRFHTRSKPEEKKKSHENFYGCRIWQRNDFCLRKFTELRNSSDLQSKLSQGK